MTALTRRSFLAVSGSAAAAAAVAGCTNRGSGGGSGDLEVAATLARMERVAVDTYRSTRATAVEGRVGAAIPQAVVEYLTTAGGHHQDHLNAWNGVLTAGGRAAVDSPDPRLRPVIDRAMIRVADIPALVALVLRLEDYASQTYLQAIPTLTGQDAVRTAAQILVVDQQHQAVLRYMLGLYPVGSGVAREPLDVAPAEPRLDLIGP